MVKNWDGTETLGYPGSGRTVDPDRKYKHDTGGRMLVDESLHEFLPIDALLAGYELRRREYYANPDPYYLYDPAGNIVRVWGYVPTLAEVDEAYLKARGQ